ncbi:Calx-beta domain-containing protein [Idiomarina abyssalis]|uniref:Calx-beta domain-containing protein n=1 Tax=Idiomarina abyssalis TaxID=86102 RepID=A0A8I1G9F3_9GAMM|nr:Calx-beta domain-containing protein [Idiomarina abyssalis]MBJ7265595.1 hypothetical protein [Idiomarina abyssalis]MBJ7316731.1 hypothetical protein [Idiomarina abyssalis]
MKRTFLTASIAVLLAGSGFAQADAQEERKQLIPTDTVNYSNQVIKKAHEERQSHSVVKAYSATSSSVADAESNGLTTIDVAVYFSPLYRDHMPRSQVVERIETYFEQVNQNALDSKAFIRFEPVFVREIAEDFSRFCGDPNFGSCTDDDRLRFNMFEQYYLGTRDWINTLMSSPEAWNGIEDLEFYGELPIRYGADLHVYFQPATDKELKEGPLGVASYMGQNTLMADTPLASLESYSDEFRPDREVLHKVQMANTLMHEIGHNLGLSHEIEDYDDPTSFGGESDQFAYTCGVGMRPGNAQTAMWSLTDLLRPAYSLYSNPDIIRNERPCGNVEVANQARVLNEYSDTAASLRDRPAVVGTVNFSQESYTAVAGQDAILIEVTRDGDIDTNTEVAILTKDGTAVEGEDYVVDTRVLKFQSGQASNTARIELTSSDGEAKTFDVVLKHPMALDIGDNNRALIQIDGSGGQFSGEVTVSTDALSFGEEQTQTVTLTRSADTDSELVVDVKTRDVSATANINYLPIDTSVRFLPGESEVSFNVSSGSATEVRTFAVDLSSPMSATFSSETINATVNAGDPGYLVFDSSVGDIYFSRDEEFTEVCEDQKGHDPDSYFADESYCHYLRTYEKDSVTLTMTLARKGGNSGQITNTVSLASLKEILEENRFNTIEWNSKLSQYYDAIGEEPPADDTTADVEQYYIEPEFYDKQSQIVTLENGETTATVTFTVTEIPDEQHIDEYGYNTLAYLETPLSNASFYYTEPGGMLATVEDWSPQSNDGGGDDDSGGGDDDSGGDDGSGDDDGGTGGDGGSSVGSGTSGGSAGWALLLLGMVGFLSRRLR